MKRIKLHGTLRLSILLLILFSFSIRGALSQESDSEHDHHVHHKNEIAVSNAPVYFVNEEEIAYGFHFHYTRAIGEQGFGIGLGYERIFDEHKHNTIGLVGSYRPIDPLVFNVSPGITFEEAEDDPEINFALHIESSYEFEINNFHIGPAVELAYDPEDYHFSLGLHIGYGF